MKKCTQCDASFKQDLCEMMFGFPDNSGLCPDCFYNGMKNPEQPNEVIVIQLDHNQDINECELIHDGYVYLIDKREKTKPDIRPFYRHKSQKKNSKKIHMVRYFYKKEKEKYFISVGIEYPCIGQAENYNELLKQFVEMVSVTKRLIKEKKVPEQKSDIKFTKIKNIW